MDKKTVQQLSNDEILHQQLQLLAEVSQNSCEEYLPALTHAMVELYKQLPKDKNLNF